MGRTKPSIRSWRRKFGGKIYELHSSHDRKRGAKGEAEYQRVYGKFARVTKEKRKGYSPSWFVWVRGKRKWR